MINKIKHILPSDIALIDVFIVFCYIFSFYIVGPVTSSLVVVFPFVFYCIYYKKWSKYMCIELKNPFVVRVFLFLCFLIGVGAIYSCLHLTMELEYIKVMFGQIIQFICGVFIIVYLKYQKHYDAMKMEKIIIWAFLVQSVIQLVAMSIPSFAQFILHFSRAHDLQDAYGGGVRGLALSSGVGWSLALAYGLVYIVFVKRYMLRGVNIENIIMGMLLFMGTFFAGRTGFVGAGLGGIYFLISNQQSSTAKLRLIIKILFGIVLFCLGFYFLFPTMTEHLIENVFPFAFEPFYRLYYNDSFSTSSTDKLGEMWESIPTIKEILLGTGYFTDPFTGAYYKHTDVGILRNLFYWGIGGYGLLIIYQLMLIGPIKYVNNQDVSRFNIFFYKCLIIVYLFFLECKAMTVGFNKMTFSIIFFIAYFYYEDAHSHSKKYIAG